MAMLRRGVTLTRPSRPFRFTYTTYLPDFYSPTEDVYYEVIGSRQRASQLLPLFDLMALVYPQIALVAVGPSGDVIDPKVRSRIVSILALPFGELLLARMREERVSFKDLAGRIGCDPSVISLAVHGRHIQRPAVFRALAGLKSFATNGGPR